MHNPLPIFTIEPALPVDIEAIDGIEQEAFNTPWNRDLLRSAIVNPQYRVRVLRQSEGRLIGFYIAHTVSRRSNLDNLAVDEWVRGNGFGSRLIDDWLQAGEQAAMDALSLQVNTANRGAQRLYERFGFTTARLLVSYYPNGEDAYHMERAVKARPGTRAPGRKGRRISARPNLTLLSNR